MAFVPSPCITSDSSFYCHHPDPALYSTPYAKIEAQKYPPSGRRSDYAADEKRSHSQLTCFNENSPAL